MPAVSCCSVLGWSGRPAVDPSNAAEGHTMTFDEVLAPIRELLQREKWVSYRALKIRFQCDDGLL